jgi:hypothetical protein
MWRVISGLRIGIEPLWFGETPPAPVLAEAESHIGGVGVRVSDQSIAKREGHRALLSDGWRSALRKPSTLCAAASDI